MVYLLLLSTALDKTREVMNSVEERKGYDTLGALREVLALQDAKDILLNLDASRISAVVELLQSEAHLASTHGSSSYRKRCLEYLRLLVKRHQILPPSLILKNIVREGTHALRGGGFSDIWKGVLGEQSVCLKVMRVHLEASEQKKLKAVKAFCEEALVWKQLSHPNVVPLLGVNTELFTPAFCLVSPWMSNGDLITYLEENPEHDRSRSIYEVASGLAYLHSLEPVVIHGDIKGANVLVDDECTCRLADFGLATIKESQGLDGTTSGGPKGTFRWMAPEVFQSRISSGADKSPRDIYAYACTVFEVMTGSPPFPGITDAAVMFEVILGARPLRPTGGWCPDHIWDLVERCWSQNPDERPRAVEIVRRLQEQVLNEVEVPGSTDATHRSTVARTGYGPLEFGSLSTTSITMAVDPSTPTRAGSRGVQQAAFSPARATSSMDRRHPDLQFHGELHNCDILHNILHNWSDLMSGEPFGSALTNSEYCDSSSAIGFAKTFVSPYKTPEMGRPAMMELSPHRRERSAPYPFPRRSATLAAHHNPTDHTNTRSSTKQFKCTWCPACFRTKQDIQRHKRTCVPSGSVTQEQRDTGRYIQA